MDKEQFDALMGKLGEVADATNDLTKAVEKEAAKPEPTPEPENIPIRWPQPTVNRPFMARIPKSSGFDMRFRERGLMGAA